MHRLIQCPTNDRILGQRRRRRGQDFSGSTLYTTANFATGVKDGQLCRSWRWVNSWHDEGRWLLATVLIGNSLSFQHNERWRGLVNATTAIQQNKNALDVNGDGYLTVTDALAVSMGDPYG